MPELALVPTLVPEPASVLVLPPEPVLVPTLVPELALVPPPWAGPGAGALGRCLANPENDDRWRSG